jgi:dTDP-4-amino-4,6-dideoxygalactose transaminase
MLKSINVTETFLPPQKEYQTILERVWKSKWLTNRGELVRELEAKIQDSMQVKNCLIMNNGTIPLQIALKLLGNGGEIITTPFSYVATTSAIVWESCTPVFVDIDPTYWTIDPSKIEAAITTKTTCILATHVFGNICDIKLIEQIAKKHSLRVIYDSAHCFGVSYEGQSVFSFGDVSTCSFHATKVFHTGEGGMICAQNEELFHQIYYSHNFGHNGSEAFHGAGINGKISELNAAMGLAVWPYFEEIVSKRKEIVESYLKLLSGLNLQLISLREGLDWNYSYFPIVFESEDALNRVMQLLNKQEIFPRRYFYPSLNTLSYIAGKPCPIAENISKRVLCLPLYHGLSLTKVRTISKIVIDSIC